LRRLSRVIPSRLWLTLLIAGQTMAKAFGVICRPDGFHVQPGDQIQDALNAAALNPTNKVVKVHAGIYRPDSKRPGLDLVQSRSRWHSPRSDGRGDAHCCEHESIQP
jgi:hypothetical protein